MVFGMVKNEHPPQTNADYEYNRTKVDVYEAPVLTELMCHLYAYPEDANDDFCFEALPKKMNEAIEYISGKNNVGWGVYLQEEPSRQFFIWLKLFSTIIPALLFGILWNVYHHDDQKSFPWTIAAWITGSLYIVLDLFEEQVKARWLSLDIKEKKD